MRLPNLKQPNITGSSHIHPADIERSKCPSAFIHVNRASSSDVKRIATLSKQNILTR